MNYDRVPGLRASEQDADDQFDDGQQDGGEGGEGNGAEDQNADEGSDDSQDDQTDDQSQDGVSQDDDSGELSAEDGQRRRRAIEDRARAARTDSDFDPVRLAGETAAATARTLANEQAARDAQAREEAAEQTALAAMNEEQKATYLLAKETRRLQHGQARTEVMLRSNGDQVAFGRVLQRSPQFAKYEAEVERRHQAVIAGGGFATRQMILEQLIGERALKGQGAVKQQKQQAQQRMQSQRSGSGRGARGDSGTGGKGEQRNSSVVARAERENWAI